MELDAVLLQILDHGQDHGLILVVPGEAQGLKVRQAADVVDEALDIPLHLQGAVPVLKSKHGAPVEPEVGVEHLAVEVVGDALVVQVLVRGEEQAHDLHGRPVGDVEFAVSAGVLAPVDGGPAEGVVGVPLVEPVVLVQDADPLGLNRGDGVEQVPHDLEMVIHLPAAPHNVAHVLELPPIAGPAGNGVLLEDMDMLPLHLTVPDQIAGGGEGRQAGADDIGGFVIHALGLLGTGERLVVSAGIIHKKHPFILFWLGCSPDRAIIGQFFSFHNKQSCPDDKFLIIGA